jgi:hypothetical protein
MFFKIDLIVVKLVVVIVVVVVETRHALSLRHAVVATHSKSKFHKPETALPQSPSKPN